LILKLEKIVLFIKVLNLLIGFPNNKYPPPIIKTKVFIVWGGRLVLGGRDCIQCTYTYTTFAKSVTAEKKGYET